VFGERSSLMPSAPQTNCAWNPAVIHWWREVEQADIPSGEKRKSARQFTARTAPAASTGFAQFRPVPVRTTEFCNAIMICPVNPSPKTTKFVFGSSGNADQWNTPPRLFHRPFEFCFSARPIALIQGNSFSVIPGSQSK